MEINFKVFCTVFLQFCLKITSNGIEPLIIPTFQSMVITVKSLNHHFLDKLHDLYNYIQNTYLLTQIKLSFFSLELFHIKTRRIFIGNDLFAEKRMSKIYFFCCHDSSNQSGEGEGAQTGDYNVYNYKRIR